MYIRTPRLFATNVKPRILRHFQGVEVLTVLTVGACVVTHYSTPEFDFGSNFHFTVRVGIWHHITGAPIYQHYDNAVNHAKECAH